MGRKKIQKKINKKRIIAKRKAVKQLQHNNKLSGPAMQSKKPTADQTTRMNEMLKVALARQQPNIMTSDPNALAANKKIEELDSKRQKQIDALTDRLATKEREAAVVQGERQHQERVGDLKRQINAADQAIEQNKQAIRDNKAHQDIEDLKRENEKKLREQEAYKKIIDSEEFKNPNSEFVKQLTENEKYKMYTKQLEQMQSLQLRNAEDRAQIEAINQLYDEKYMRRKRRFTHEFLKVDGFGHPIEELLKPNQYYQEIDEGRPFFIKVDGDRRTATMPLSFDKASGRYKDANGRDVLTYEYQPNNVKSDYELFQQDLMAQEEQNRELQRNLKTSKALVDDIEGIKDRISDLTIENNKLVNELRLTDGYVYKYNKDNGKPTQNLIDLYEAVTDASHERARNEAQLDYAKEKVAAHKAELEAHKQKEYTKAMRDAFNSETYQAQRKEIADAQNRANLARMAKEEAQKDIDLQKSLAEQEGQKQLLQLSIQQGGFNPEVIAQAQTQIASQARAAVGNPELLDAIGRFNTQYKQLGSIPQQMVNRILERTGIETNAIHHPESYNYELHPGYFRAATQIVNDVAAWSQQDPYDSNTVNSDYFVNNYEINLSNF